MKSLKSLTSFAEYCENHPEERFWQALRNWSGYGFIYGQDDKGAGSVVDTAKDLAGREIKLHDTFYLD